MGCIRRQRDRKRTNNENNSLSQTLKKGIQPTIYEARASFNTDENKVSIIEMKNKLLSPDKNIGFSHVIPSTMNFNNEVTKVGIQFIGSPLSYQLLPLEENFKTITNLSKVNYVAFVNQTFPDLLWTMKTDGMYHKKKKIFWIH